MGLTDSTAVVLCMIMCDLWVRRYRFVTACDDRTGKRSATRDLLLMLHGTRTTGGKIGVSKVYCILLVSHVLFC